MNHNGANDNYGMPPAAQNQQMPVAEDINMDNYFQFILDGESQRGLAVMHHDAAHLRNHFDATEENNRLMMMEVVEKSKNIDELEVELKEWKARTQIIGTEHDKTVEREKQAKAELTTMREEFEEKAKRIDEEYHGKLVEMERRLTKMTEERKTVGEVNGRLQEANDRLQEENGELKKTLNTTIGLKKAAQEEFEKQIADLNGKLIGANARVEENENAKGELKKQLEEAEATIRLKETEEGGFKEQIAQLKKKLDEANEKFQEEIEKKNGELETMETQKDAAYREKEQELEKVREDARKKKRSLVDWNSKLAQDVQNAGNEKKRIAQQLEAVTKELADERQRNVDLGTQHEATVAQVKRECETAKEEQLSAEREKREQEDEFMEVLFGRLHNADLSIVEYWRNEQQQQSAGANGQMEGFTVARMREELDMVKKRTATLQVENAKLRNIIENIYRNFQVQMERSGIRTAPEKEQVQNEQEHRDDAVEPLINEENPDAPAASSTDDGDEKQQGPAKQRARRERINE